MSLLAFVMWLAMMQEKPKFVYTPVRPSNAAVVSQEFWREVEKHCVAVLTEKHVEKIPVATYGQPLPEVSKDGEEIIQVPEQTLKLRCK